MYTVMKTIFCLAPHFKAADWRNLNKDIEAEVAELKVNGRALPT